MKSPRKTSMRTIGHRKERPGAFVMEEYSHPATLEDLKALRGRN
ncbi:MAG: hypothetical protein Q8J72_09730 [Rhodocyclaceae bacterium]|nr:hypothetical protein [Rhodocyclaceae bacterium]